MICSVFAIIDGAMENVKTIVYAAESMSIPLDTARQAVFRRRSIRRLEQIFRRIGSQIAHICLIQKLLNHQDNKTGKENYHARSILFVELPVGTLRKHTSSD